MYIISVIIIAVLAYIFRQKKTEEKAVNSARIPQQVKKWEPVVIAAARKYNVPSTIAISVLWVESAGNPNARGSAGEYGLMQLKEIAVKDLELNGFGKFPGWDKNPEQNIRAGVAYLALQKRRTGDWFEAVKAYNQGYAGMQRYPQRAAAYLQKVRAKEPFFG